jgi:hypothetical protein
MFDESLFSEDDSFSGSLLFTGFFVSLESD